MTLISGVLPTLIILCVLILIHEWGHYLACLVSGVRVERFSLGFGPEIFHLKRGHTTYAVSLFPIGGYVKPSGESISEIGSAGLQPYDYLAAPVWKRIFIVIAGVLMNYLLALVLFVAIFLIGRPVPLAQVGEFVKGYPAEASGLAVGDRILAVGGTAVDSWEDFFQAMNRVKGAEAFLRIQRDGQIREFHVPLKVEEVRDIFGKAHSLPRIGIRPDPKAYRIERLSLGPALYRSLESEAYLTGMTYKGFYYLLTGRLSVKTLSGPLGIMRATGSAAKMGVVFLLNLTAILSISLAVINLLPIPALDGGHLFFLLIEAVGRRKVSPEFQERCTQIGFALLMLLTVFVFYNDLVNLQILDRVKSALAR